MTTSYRDKLNAMRQQNKSLSNQQENSLDPVAKEDQMLGEIELTIDANDLPAEIIKNLKANLGPIDTEDELEAHGLKNKQQPDEDKEHSNSFCP